MEEIKVVKAWVTDTDVWIRTADGREASEKIADYPRLRFATPKQRERFTLSDDGIHWREIDEDLSFEGFFDVKNANPLYRLFIMHPELNASAIARRLRMSQILFASSLQRTFAPDERAVCINIQSWDSVRQSQIFLTREIFFPNEGILFFQRESFE